MIGALKFFITRLAKKREVEMYDYWLRDFFDDTLSKINDGCARGDRVDVYEVFKDIHDDDLWNILLSRKYGIYPNILKCLPDLPDEKLQQKWVGLSGMPLNLRTLAFYAKVKNVYRCYGNKPLEQSIMLDFGCGWGRIIRYFAKDVPNSNLLGCDPDANILEECLRLRVPGILKRSDHLPQTLPFPEKLDLAYAFSIFTHLSEKTHRRCLETLHAAMVPGAILIITIRPRGFLEVFSKRPVERSQQEMDSYRKAYDRGDFVFVPHNRPPIEGEVTFGDACIPYPYILKQWTQLFEIVDIGLLTDDIHQIPIVLRRR